MQRHDLAGELVRSAAEDLAVRERLLQSGDLAGGYNAEMRVVHRRNGDRLTEILDELGCWPHHELVGVDGSEAAFLIAQHDISNPKLLRRAFRLYAAAVANNQAEPRWLANLEDRIRYFEGRPQRYGTHVGWDEHGNFGSWPPVQDPERVDELRAGLGLVPLSEALAKAADGRVMTRPIDEVLAEHQAADDFARESGWRSDCTP